MKLTKKAVPYYQHGRVLKPNSHRQYLRLKETAAAALVCTVILSFVSTFSTFNKGGQLKQPNNSPSAVSSQGKIGVSRPVSFSVIATDLAESKAVTGSTTKSQANPLAQIPPKPIWVTKLLFTDPANTAAQYISSNPNVDGNVYIARMAKIPVAQWFGDWNSNIKDDVNSYVSAAASVGKVPIVVVYNIPNRDCGGYSVGGANGLASYTEWVNRVAEGIGGRTAVVVVEPDALSALDCLPVAQQQERIQSIAQAVTILKAQALTSVYIDSGTAVWQPAKTMASRLESANIGAADGFSLNISYFAPTAQSRAYGDQLSSLIGFKHYIIDTSRNGGNNTVTGMQCNPPFASFGDMPTTITNNPLNDALLWIKIPWESDGECNGSPGPGQEYWSYAIQLAKNAGW